MYVFNILLMNSSIYIKRSVYGTSSCIKGIIKCFCSKTSCKNNIQKSSKLQEAVDTFVDDGSSLMSNKTRMSSSSKTRVIGIMAHIDAGKTTTTERMLYYSGFQQTIGEVHHGDTTMDYLELERQRGITIQSAAISFPWREHNISLVDTPGHVDFTVEVERCLRVVDGAIALLDASAGVEAQTVTVWRQADRYSVPRLCYLNKMDKPAACHRQCLHDLRSRLHVNPLLLQVPIGSGKEFRGVVDVLSGYKLEWGSESERDRGATYTISSAPITPTSDPDLYPDYAEARVLLCDQMGDMDDAVAECILDAEDATAVPPHLLAAAVRRATISQKCVPVLLGSSYRNTGVQPLLDAVLSYLPAPSQRPAPSAALLYAPHLCALAFKIVNEPKKGGLLTFVRIYSGRLEQGSRVYNVSRQCTERPTKLYTALADHYKEIESADPGDIVVLGGLKKTVTGDTLVTSQSHVASARQKLEKIKLTSNTKPKFGSEFASRSPTTASVDTRGKPLHSHPVRRNKEEEIEDLFKREDEDDSFIDQEEEEQHLLVGVKVPEPVFFCSVEASSPRFQLPLEEALKVMQREDPSLLLRHDEETGQLVLAGMGELHLEVVASRLHSQYAVEAELGQLEVAYREEIAKRAQHTLNVEKTIGEQRLHVNITLQLEPAPGERFSKVQLLRNRDNEENLLSIRRPQLASVTAGVRSALSCGPVLGCPVDGVRVYLCWLEARAGAGGAFLAAIAGQCVKQLLMECECRLSEPIMLLSLSADVDHSHELLPDLARRRADVKEVSVRAGQKHILAHVPLSELVGYSTSLRRLSSGRSTLTMELHAYRVMQDHEQREAIKRVTGFYPT